MKNKICNLSTQIESKRIIIKSTTPVDTKEVRLAIKETHRDLKQWFGWAQKIPSEAETKRNLTKARNAFKKNQDLRFHIFKKETGQFIGVCGFHRIDWSVPRFEIAYWCNKKFQKKGYISEAVTAMTNFAFKKLKAKRVEILIDEKNKRSRRIPQRLKYKLEGRIKNHSRNPQGKLKNLLIYSKTK